LHQHAEPDLPDHFFAALPKVELHRHLEGSLRLQTMTEIARAHGMDIAGTGQLRPLVQVQNHDPMTFQNFLSKFETLRLFYRSPEVIARISREAIADAAADHVRYMELRFTPVALSVARGFELGQVMDWVIEHTSAASQEYGIKTNLICSMNRHESVALAEKVVKQAVDRKDRGIVAIDLAGNEAQFSALPFAGLFKEARQAGLHITAHAGEWGGPENIAVALVNLGAERIGHGVRVLEDSSVVDLAASRGAAFEVCITSNYQSGVVPALSEHPFVRMLNRGLNVTLNTDDPSVSGIVLSDEYRVASQDLGLPLNVLSERILAAAQAAFLPEHERQRLIADLSTELQNWLGG
jgi:adenosine deaminase